MNRVSIIVPTHNEEGSIDALIQRISASMKKHKVTYEIIFVDDYSTDRTQKTIQKFAHREPVRLFVKQGKRGKAYSILEGFSHARYDAVAMIDADLQYAPEAIPEMLKKLKTDDVVVSNRRSYQSGFIRRLMHTSFRGLFGKVLYGLSQDVQSGLKIFKREVLETIQFSPKSAWTFDLEFLIRAREAGFTITDYEIDFADRTAGRSHVGFLKSSFEVGMNALLLKAHTVEPIPTDPEKKKSMKGAGVRYGKRKYVTHTTLDYSQSAIKTFVKSQKIAIGIILFVLLIGFIISPLTTLKILIAVLSFIYFSDVFFNLYIILKSLHQPQELSVSEKELRSLKDTDLPVYSILCPLYKESHVIPQFLSSISKLDYPKKKLDVMLLLEEDDTESIEAVKHMRLPSYVRVVVVPDSQPKTKPKACNYGLSLAKGEYLVIYDAEDIPEPMQLKTAVRAFQKVPKNVWCLQAKLNYYNPNQNLLTRFFTAEYSLWFDVTLTGLQSINTSIPLGGTSNHFRTKDLIRLQGWDPFNVTEDADLGMRLFRAGYKTAIIDSTTLEEANSRWGNWLRQRSRWIKGYMQTYLVHNRHPKEFVEKNGIHSLYFQLTVGGKIAFILINPLLWLATFSYFALYRFVGPAIESFYPSIVFYMAVVSLVFGNFLFLFYYMIGVAKREQWNLMKYVFLVPLYWIMISVAGFIALYELLFKPHYWQKTVHGFHLLPQTPKAPAAVPATTIEPEEEIIKSPRKLPTWAFPSFVNSSLFNAMVQYKRYLGGFAWIAATMGANVLNFVFNAYLGRALNLKDFALVSLIGSIYSFALILFSSLGMVLTYRGGFLIGRYGLETGDAFFRYIRKQSFIVGMLSTLCWIIAIPFLVSYFHTGSALPFILFIPIWIVGFNESINKGYISAKLQFGVLAAVILFEPMIKLLSSYLLVNAQFSQIAYFAIPLSIAAGFIYSSLGVVSKKPVDSKVSQHTIKSFPTEFFLASIISGLSSLTFLSFDVVLAKHYLSAEQAGQYALISLVGKMVYFMASLSTQFIVPLISRSEGERKDSQGIFYKILIATCILTGIAYIPLGLLAQVFVPILFGAKSQIILPYLPLFLLAMMAFSISRVFISYYQIKELYLFPIVAFLLSIVQFTLINHAHAGVNDMVNAMVITGILSLVTLFVMHLRVDIVNKIEMNFEDLFALFRPLHIAFSKQRRNILIFNWRDTKHKWAGGAETYIHELSKRWVEDGNTVVVFCGNDYSSQRDQIIDGVYVMRRGGFYSMYMWAAIYYVCKFRGKFDVVIDSENGIPFFTPLFSSRPVFLLIHHVHQEVFREHLAFPLSVFARWIEGVLMPFVYRGKTVITVSESSKKEIKRLGFTKSSQIQIINPGIELGMFKKRRKTSHPSILYIGRLKPYKNVDRALRAFVTVLEKFPKAQFIVAGEGESKYKLIKLSQKLGIDSHVSFPGKVSEEEKSVLLATSWIAVQPSMIEGWGITVIEANASGTPVVASRVNGLKDSVSDKKTGILVNPKKDREISSAIISLFENRALRKVMSQNAVEWSRNFSWEKSAKAFYSIISSTQEKRNSIISIIFSREQEAAAYEK